MKKPKAKVVLAIVIATIFAVVAVYYHLPSSNPITHLTADNFQAEVIEASQSQLVVVKFWASWCSYCKAYAPIFEFVAEEFKEVKFAEFEISGDNSITTQYSIMGIPNTKFFRNSIVVDEVVGLMSEEALTQKVEANLEE